MSRKKRSALFIFVLCYDAGLLSISSSQYTGELSAAKGRTVAKWNEDRTIRPQRTESDVVIEGMKKLSVEN